jgi:bla regulator protein BlaR1
MNQINHFAQMWFDWQVSIFWQVAILIAIIACVDFLIKKWAWPQVRYALWLLVLVKLILPPSLTSPASFTAEIPIALQNAAVKINQPQISPPVIETIPANIVTISKPVEISPQNENILHDGGDTVNNEIETVVISWKVYALCVWVFGAFILGLWLVLRLRNLRREHLKSSNQIPVKFLEILGSVGKKYNLKTLPQIILTNKVSCPAVFGIFKPVLLMPAKNFENISEQQAEHIFLHELAHIKRGDLIVHAIYMMLQIAYWFNPLLWIIRRHLQNLRELCCDATVARILREQTADYRQTLLETAKRLIAEPVDPGLGLLGLFENSSRLIDRLRWLEKKTWKYRPLRIATVFILICVMSACVLPMAKFKSNADFVIKGRVTDAQTGKPIEGAKVGDANEYADGKFFAVTDSNGDYSYQTYYEEHNIKCTAEGYKQENETLLTKVLGKEKEQIIDFKLSATKFEKEEIKIGGIVVDQNNKPISNVKVEFRWDVETCSMRMLDGGEVFTNEQGEWEALMPADIQNISLRFAHKDYVKKDIWNFKVSTFAEKQIFKLESGINFSGKVVSEDGKPIDQAVLMPPNSVTSILADGGVAISPTMAQTDSNGNFTLSALSKGENKILVDAKGYAPKVVAVDSDKEIKPQTIILAKGKIVTGIIHDANGKPIEGAGVKADYWRVPKLCKLNKEECWPWEQYTILRLETKSDANGYFAIENAPDSGILEVHIGKKKSGYLYYSNDVNLAEDKLIEITVYKPPVICGNVVDEQTGEPIKEFSLTEGLRWSDGNYPPSWLLTSTKISSSEGRFSACPQHFMCGKDMPYGAVRIEKEGYLPEVILQRVGEKYVPVTVKLKKGIQIIGQIFSPDSNPIENAEVTIVDEQHEARIDGLSFDKSSIDTPEYFVKTSKAGEFKFPPIKGKAYIAAIHKTGWGIKEINPNDTSNKIVLTPWAKIKGQIKNFPNKNVYVMLWEESKGEIYDKRIHWGGNMPADSQGHFNFEYVPSLKMKLACETIPERQRIEIDAFLPQQSKEYEVVIDGNKSVWRPQPDISKAAEKGQKDFSIKLSNGTIVELVGVCRFKDGKSQDSWRPDGNKSMETFNAVCPSGDPCGIYGLIIRTKSFAEITDFDAKSRRTSGANRVARFGATIVDANGNPTKLAEKHQEHIIAALLEDINSTDVAMAVTSEDWQAKAKYDGKYVTKYDPQIKFIEAYDTKEGVKVVFTNEYEKYGCQSRLVAAYNFAGRNWRNMPGSMQTVYAPDGSIQFAALFSDRNGTLKLSDIKEFRLDIRSKSEWVEFKNVSLKPGFKTDVEVGKEEPDNQKIYPINFEITRQAFLPGDSIEITQISGSTDTFEPNQTYTIKGKYTLSSHDDAMLHVYATNGEITSQQGPVIKSGSGDFERTFVYEKQGWLHLSFYPANGGSSFGNLYFAQKGSNEKVPDFSTITSKVGTSNFVSGDSHDIDVYIEDFNIYPYEVGGLYRLTVKIGNKGTATTPAFRMNFYKGDPKDGLNLFGKPQSGNHGAGPIKPVEFWNECSQPFAINEGENYFSAVLDTENNIAESNKTNNQAVLFIKVENGKITKKFTSPSAAIEYLPNKTVIEARNAKAIDANGGVYFTKVKILAEGTRNEDSRALLLKQKDILEKTLQTVKMKHDSGQATGTELMNAQMDVLRVDRELAETPQQRIAISEQIVSLYKEHEQLTEKLVAAGKASQDDVDKIKLQRLDAEKELIALKNNENVQAEIDKNQTAKDEIPKAAVLPENVQSMIESVPGKLVFHGRYRHHSRGKVIEMPSELWLKQDANGGINAFAYLPWRSSSDLANGDNNNRLIKYKTTTQATEGKEGYYIELKFDDGKALLNRRGVREDRDNFPISVSRDASFNPNSRPDSYCADNIFLRSLNLKPGEKKEFRVFDWGGTGDELVDYSIQITNEGKEHIVVPAGNFEANHYVLQQVSSADTWFKKQAGHLTDYWVLDNNIIVRVLRHREPYEMELLDYTLPENLHQKIKIKEFEITKQSFLEGDSIEITEIMGSTDKFEPNQTYTIKGKYTLSSHDDAMLHIYATNGEITSQQGHVIKSGSGEFVRTFKYLKQGSLHLSFYPTNGGSSFGGIYFAQKAVNENQVLKSEEPNQPDANEFPKPVTDTNESMNQMFKLIGEITSQSIELQKLKMKNAPQSEIDNLENDIEQKKLQLQQLGEKLGENAEVTGAMLAEKILSKIQEYIQNNSLPISEQTKNQIEEALKKTQQAIDANQAYSDSQTTPLHLAVMNNHMETAATLISKGADVNAKDSQGNTPLHLAASNGSPDMCAFLIEKGADINAKNNNGRTPLDLAASKGHNQTVDLLVQKGASISPPKKQSNAVYDEEMGKNLPPDMLAFDKWSFRTFSEFLDCRRFGTSYDEETLISQLNNRKSNAYYKAINILACLKSQKAVPSLAAIAFTKQEKDNRDRWMAARALGIIGDKSVTGDLIHLMYHPNNNTRLYARISLIRLTGKDLGPNWEKWAKWYKKKVDKSFSTKKIEWTDNKEWSDVKKQRQKDEDWLKRLQDEQQIKQKYRK